MKSHRIAITGVSGDAGFGIVKGLRQGYPTAEILGLDFNIDCAAIHLCDQYKTMPRITDDAYIPALTSVLTSHKTEFLIPGIDAELPILSYHRRKIESVTNTSLLLCEHSKLINCTDKLNTFHWLTEMGFKAPHTISPCTESEIRDLEFILEEFKNRFPIVIKPRKGHGSIGIRYVYNADELASNLPSLTPDDCLQEYIDGPEITCGLLFDQTGLLADYVCMKRILKNGRTVSASVYDNPELHKFIKLFAKRSRLTGPINLQLRIDQAGYPQVFEINPRLSGSTQIRIAVGFNDPARLVEHYLDKQPIRTATIEKAHVYRTESTLLVKPSQTRFENIIQKASIKGNDIRNIIFKCEGVLLRQYPDRSLRCQQVLNRLGYHIPVPEIQQAYATVDFAFQSHIYLDSRVENKSDTSNTLYHNALAAALGVSSVQSDFDPLLQKELDHNTDWYPVSDSAVTLKNLLSSQRIDLHVWSAHIFSLPELLQQAYSAEVLDSIHLLETTSDQRSVQSNFITFKNHPDISPDTTICVGNQYEPEMRLCREQGFFPILLDFDQRFSTERDCPSFKSWHQMNQFLSAFLQDCEQEISKE